jgi:uncharacterized protein (TIGR02147 family)
MGQVRISNILLEHYEKRRVKNPAYSHHAFAQLLGVSSGALSEIFRGKRRLSKKKALTLATTLELRKSEWQQFMSAFDGDAADASLKYSKIQMDHYKIISDWQHLALLSLIETSSFENDSQWIARKLGISQANARSAMDRLIETNLVSMVGNKPRRTSERITTADGVTNLPLRAAHRKSMELASSALDKISVDMRDFVPMTSAVDLDKIPEVKKIIRKCLNQISTLLDEGNRTEVYKISVQFFPLTQLEPRI